LAGELGALPDGQVPGVHAQAMAVLPGGRHPRRRTAPIQHNWYR
jgi:hypothetical protein